MNIDNMERLIKAAKKDIECDLVLKNSMLVDVFNGDVFKTDIGIIDGRIAGFGKGYRGMRELDLEGSFVSPGLIDSHIHIESTMLTPKALGMAILCHGTTTIISDPHEIANVMGLDGIMFMIDDSKASPVDIYFTAPSCVPASSLESSYEHLDAQRLSQLRTHERIIALGEVMNFPGVIRGAPEVLSKLALFSLKDGHAPGLVGQDLMAYISAGISSDHETIRFHEGLEKLRAGMFLMIREGSTAKNLEELVSLITPQNVLRACFVSDDLSPLELLREGHLDRILKKAVSLGLDPISAIRMVTLSPAIHYSLRDRGGVFPGAKADLVVFWDLKDFKVKLVIKDGDIVFEEGALRLHGFPLKPTGPVANRINFLPFERESLKVPAKSRQIRVIELIPGQIITNQGIEEAHVRDGVIVSDPARDILKIVVVERHRATGNKGIGFVKGIGLKYGAIASTISHDSHNIISVGVEDEDIYFAIQKIKEIQGGLVVVRDQEVLAQLPLPVAGLMSNHTLEEVCASLEEVNRATKSLGCTLNDPFISLSFLALSVIPDLKITDAGLVDVKRAELVSLFV